MAKFARRLAEGRWHVTITGHLGAGDLLRLERVCAPALDRRPMPLVLQIEHLTGLDDAARLFLHRLLDRGAVTDRKSGALAGEILRAPTRHSGPINSSDA